MQKTLVMLFVMVVVMLNTLIVKDFLKFGNVMASNQLCMHTLDVYYFSVT